MTKFNQDDRCLGIGGAPTRTTILPDAAAERKKFPIASGLLDYFPDALAVVANVSYIGNEQHNAGQPLHWARGKSADEADTMLRHFMQRGLRDKDGTRHSAKMVWRALALLQKELEEEMNAAPLPGEDDWAARHQQLVRPDFAPVTEQKNHPPV